MLLGKRGDGHWQVTTIDLKDAMKRNTQCYHFNDWISYTTHSLKCYNHLVRRGDGHCQVTTIDLKDAMKRNTQRCHFNDWVSYTTHSLKCYNHLVRRGDGHCQVSIIHLRTANKENRTVVWQKVTNMEHMVKIKLTNNGLLVYQ